MTTTIKTINESFLKATSKHLTISLAGFVGFAFCAASIFGFKPLYLYISAAVFLVYLGVFIFILILSNTSGNTMRIVLEDEKPVALHDKKRNVPLRDILYIVLLEGEKKEESTSLAFYEYSLRSRRVATLNLATYGEKACIKKADIPLIEEALKQTNAVNSIHEFMETSSNTERTSIGIEEAVQLIHKFSK